MRALIVESTAELGLIWQRHLRRHGVDADLATTQQGAVENLRETPYDILIVDLVLGEGSALAVTDYASYRQPDARVIFVTNTSFFSDGSIFRHCANACAFIPTDTTPDDILAMVEHYGRD